MSVVALRRLALASWIGSGVLIVLAGVFLVAFGTAAPVAPGDVDTEVQQAVAPRAVSLGTVATVALLGAVAFAGGAALRRRADEIERREVASGFGIRPPRPPRPPRSPVRPSTTSSHDDVLSQTEHTTEPPTEPADPTDPAPTHDPDREQP